MDFVEGIPKSDGYSVILVMVDRFTKYAHFIPLKHPYNAAIVARAVFNNVIKLHGLPQTIVSDRDKIFTSAIWKELFRLMGTQLLFSSAYHPQTDGQTERVNQCLEMYLCCVVYDDPKQWKQMLSQAEYWYNTSFHTSLGCSPFHALYGYDLNNGYMQSTTDTGDSVHEMVQTVQTQTRVLKEHLAKAQNKMKMVADKNRVDREYQVGGDGTTQVAAICSVPSSKQTVP